MHWIVGIQGRLGIQNPAGVSGEYRFTYRLLLDHFAATADLTYEWSRPVEGHVYRLKHLKRQSYGRAGFQTLRKQAGAAMWLKKAVQGRHNPGSSTLREIHNVVMRFGWLIVFGEKKRGSHGASFIV